MSGNAPNRICFLTDYGHSDAFAGICRAVLTSGAPGTEVMDLTHGIPPGDVRRGALVLESAVEHTGPAVFLAVVDPGVGGDRRAVAVRAGDAVFVGPDNGLLIEACDRMGGAEAAVEISSSPFAARTRSHTFHGRDVFAPVAAALARGEDLGSVGEAIDPAGLVRLDLPESTVVDDEVWTHVLVEDGYGNLSLGLTVGEPGLLPFRPGETLVIRPEGGQSFEAPFVKTFGSVPVGAPLVFVDSSDRLAIAVNLGSARDELGLARDHPLVISPAGPTSH